MSSVVQPTVLIIVGITGDLSKRKLLPAIERIVKAEAVPERFKLIGITRKDTTTAELLQASKVADEQNFLANNLQMVKMDLDLLSDYQQLSNALDAIDVAFGEPAQRLFYLSVPPQVSQPIIELMGQAGLASHPGTKLLFEKPFGTNLESAKALISHTREYFDEDRIYRIDHYLAKEMAQNIIVFREGNALFKRTWNREFIESITIFASETIGIEGRDAFYEQTGAMRDLVQSHLLQLAALTLMETPRAGNLSEVPSRRLQALQQLYLSTERTVQSQVKRGQYQTYTTEVNNPDSKVETYVDMTLSSSDPRWEGVPIRIMTGKALKKKSTEIHIIYKREQDYESNELIIQLQPNEGFSMRIWSKVSGYEKELQQRMLSHSLSDDSQQLPEAYEQVFHDAINSDHTLFASSEEVLETWRIVTPVLEEWAKTNDDLIIYSADSEIGTI